MEWALVFAGFTAFAALASGVAWLVRSLWKLSQRFTKLMEEVFGDPQRPEERPGMMHRLHAIEQYQSAAKQKIDHIQGELYENGGHSLRDTVNYVKQAVDRCYGDDDG